VNKYYFTFGFGHHQPGKSLSAHYTCIESDDEGKARETMSERRANKWAFCYEESEKEKAIDKFDLTFIPFDEVEAQVGETH
jgi:hypothetical protein